MGINHIQDFVERENKKLAKMYSLFKKSKK